jgi:hypothetical protein
MARRTYEGSPQDKREDARGQARMDKTTKPFGKGMMKARGGPVGAVAGRPPPRKAPPPMPPPRSAPPMAAAPTGAAPGGVAGGLPSGGMGGFNKGGKVKGKRR